MENLTQSFESVANKPTENQHEKAGFSATTLILILLFLVLTGYGAFQMYNISKVNNEITVAETELKNLKESNINDNKAVTTQLRAQFLSQKSKDRIFWTNVIYNIDNSLIKGDKINISTISGTENGTVTINANTTLQSLNPFVDTADLITVFKTKPFFQNVFVQNINSTVNESGTGQLTYTLRFNYKKEETERTPIQASEILKASPSNTEAPTNADPAVIEELRQRLNQSNQ
jgi:hypothetical protein